MKKIKVLQLYGKDVSRHGGMESIVRFLSSLQEDNFTIDTLSLSKNNDSSGLAGNYKTYNIDFEIPRLPISFDLAKDFRERVKSYDILHIHHPDIFAFLLVYLIRPQIPIVVHWHSDIIHQRIRKIFFRPIQEFVLNKSDAIICTSQNYADGSKDLKSYRNKVKVAPLAVDPSSMTEDAGFTSKLKERFKGKKVIFSLGRLVPYKGFHLLIEAAKHLPNDYLIIIGGEGPLRKKLESLIASNNLSDKVMLIGKVPDSQLASWYKTADVFCLPSVNKAEAFGVVLLEAMSFGTPLVTFDMEDSGVSFVNKNNVTGLVVHEQTPSALATSMCKIAKNQELKSQMSQKCKQRVKEEFTLDVMEHNLRNIYGGIMRRNTA